MKRGPIYREAQIRLRDFIRERGLRAGDRLPPEATLAEELEVSRPSLREATRSLQTLGVIEAQPGNGLFVAEFSFRPVIEQLPYGLAELSQGLEEILTAREAMEVGLMPAVARMETHEALDRCADLAEQMTVLEHKGESIEAVDRDFHLTLYRPLSNPLVDNLIELFWELFVRLGDAIPGRPEKDRGEAHLRIVRALQSGDGSAAITHMREHFDDVRERAAKLGGNGS
ncbi:FadR/GntR family transcriptional regulator [Solicola gregarius]|uniref:GntR family transcriptional regulator n=1 Tax=Solicola gregarius TaxID=2908642 RepID=A0AA46TI22_9ACTN|nr:FCD domain-containing protein [Solicola gregarius]UYM05571.1 GntR family transcriptional regulator [Solicola gregarius]